MKLFLTAENAESAEMKEIIQVLKWW